MTEMTAEIAAALRAEFPADRIGLLPKVTCRDCSDKRKQCTKHTPAKCRECQAWISSAHIHIDYAGHGAVTDRLLDVDPEWNWEPMAYDTNGLPLMTYNQQMEPVSLWIRLTVAGVTRPGVGSCPDGQFDAEKVLLGDALRNAAMRFGVALDLWIKGHAEDDERTTATNQRSRPAATGDPEKLANLHARVNGLDGETRGRVRAWVDSKGFPDHPRKLNDNQADQVNAYLDSLTDDGPAPRAPTGKMLTALNTLLGSKQGLTGDDRLVWLSDRHGRDVPSTKALSFDEVSALIDELGSMPDRPKETS